MTQLGPKTKKNLEDAFAGESMARNKYTYFSKIAKKAGYEQVAKLFLETAENEKEHAKMWARELGYLTDIKDALKGAIAGEKYENVEMYPRMAAEAREEGHNDIADLLEHVGKAEVAHQARYQKLLDNIESDKVFKRGNEVKWKCGNCGYVHTGVEAPDECPSCRHPKTYFELFVEAY